MLLNCGVREDSWKSLGLQDIQPVNPKGNHSWIFFGRTENWSWNSNGHLTQRTDSFEKTLMLGKIEGRKRRGWQRMRWLDDITDTKVMILVGSRSWWWIWKSGMLLSVGSQRVGHDWMTELNLGHLLITTTSTLPISRNSNAFKYEKVIFLLDFLWNY